MQIELIFLRMEMVNLYIASNLSADDMTTEKARTLIQHKYFLTSMGNPIVEIRRFYDRLVSKMEFSLPARYRYIESGPGTSTMYGVYKYRNRFKLTDHI